MGTKQTIAIYVLATLVILETLFLVLILSLGYEAIQNENICSIDICDDDGYYVYDDYTGLCECFGTDMQLKYKEILT